MLSRRGFIGMFGGVLAAAALPFKSKRRLPEHVGYGYVHGRGLGVMDDMGSIDFHKPIRSLKEDPRRDVLVVTFDDGTSVDVSFYDYATWS